jgi:hypothetical protein
MEEEGEFDHNYTFAVLILFCAICFGFIEKPSSGTIKFLVERTFGYNAVKFQVTEISTSQYVVCCKI